MQFNIPTSILGLSKDVEAPLYLTVHGEYTGANGEIIVIRQLRREIFTDAYVCHITDGSKGTGIYDMPNFQFIKLGYDPIHQFGEYRFTMACIAESIKNLDRPCYQRGIGLTNWL